MSCVVSAIPAVSRDSVATKVVKRQSANFQPSIWGDYFLKYASPDGESMVGLSYNIYGFLVKNELFKVIFPRVPLKLSLII